MDKPKSWEILEVIELSNGGFKVKFTKDVEITVNGQPVLWEEKVSKKGTSYFDKSLFLNNPRKDNDFLLEKGYITDQKHREIKELYNTGYKGNVKYSAKAPIGE